MMDKRMDVPWGDKETDRDKELKRFILRLILAIGFIVAVLYEYSQRYPSPDTSPSPPADVDPTYDDHAHTLNFAEELRKAKQEPGLEFDISDVKAEYVEKYGDGAKALLCSACKITAQCIGDELHSRNAEGVPDPTALLNVTKEANTAACENIPKPLLVTQRRKGGAYFSTDGLPAGKKLTGVEQRKADVAWKSAQRLCMAALQETRWAMLEALIRHKVPHAKKRWGSLSGGNTDNWERWLCAKRLRICKRSEVKDDDEDDASDEL